MYIYKISGIYYLSSLYATKVQISNNELPRPKLKFWSESLKEREFYGTSPQTPLRHGEGLKYGVMPL